jgi:NifU-like protein involved in Fe-S cluster formation
MAEALYTIDILRLAASLGQWPPMPGADGHAERRSPTCGSVVAVDATLATDGTLGAIGLSVSACALGQASAAILARHAPGRLADDIAGIRRQLADYLAGEADQLPDWPGMEHLAPARAYRARHPSILLPFDATLDALAEASTDLDGRAHG